MQINNILDFDDEASVKAYNFTITAIKEFYDTIESDQFTAAGGDTIYAYLTKVMELVSSITRNREPLFPSRLRCMMIICLTGGM